MKKSILILMSLSFFIAGYLNGYEIAYDKKCVSLFVNKMNEKAQELGMLNTNFADPSGLLYENIGTVDDVLLLLQACVNENIIMSIWNQDSSLISIYDNNNNERVVQMYNTFISDSIVPYNVLGRKTGSDGYIYNVAILLGDSSDKYTSCAILNAYSEVERLNVLRNVCNGDLFESDRISVCYEFYGGGDLIRTNST